MTNSHPTSFLTRLLLAPLVIAIALLYSCMGKADGGLPPSKTLSNRTSSMPMISVPDCGDKIGVAATNQGGDNIAVSSSNSLSKAVAQSQVATNMIIMLTWNPLTYVIVGSTNLTNWYVVTNVLCYPSNVTVTATKSFEAFRLGVTNK